MEIIKVRIADLIPYAGNAKQHPVEQIAQIKESIELFGFNDPIAIDQDNVVIEGHGRLLALKELGYEEVECIRLVHLTNEQRRAYTLIHNKLTMNSGFDLKILEAELKQIEGIDMGAFDLSLDDIHLDGDESDEVAVEEVDVPELPKSESQIKRGQVWRLGQHRLMCGDSTNAEDVKTLLGGGEADLLVTDPPYNVDYEGVAGKIQNDNMTNAAFLEFLSAAFSAADSAMRPGAVFYIWHADSEGYNFRSACAATNWKIRECLIWKKNALVLGRQDYQWIHEPCLYGWKDGAAHYFINDRKQTTVFEDPELLNFHGMKKEDLVALLDHIYSEELPKSVIEEDKPSRSELHPTMKPVRLIARLVKNSSKQGWRVLDLFGGSGTTLVACEQLNRTCCMMEYDPKYVRVIIQRWEQLTGGTAELVEE